MANSARHGPVGHRPRHRHQPHRVAPPSKALVPSKTAGTTGIHDQGDTTLTTLHGWLPNVTGLWDWADHTLHELVDSVYRVTAPGTPGKMPDGQKVSTGSPPAAPPLPGQITKDQLKKPFKLAKDDVLTLKQFGYYKKHPDEAETDGYIKEGKKVVQHAASAETIANKIYGGRKGLGNKPLESADGFLYRGRGLIQVAGRDNYRSITNEYKLLFAPPVDFEANPDLAMQFPYDLGGDCPNLAALTVLGHDKIVANMPCRNDDNLYGGFGTDLVQFGEAPKPKTPLLVVDGNYGNDADKIFVIPGMAN